MTFFYACLYFHYGILIDIWRGVWRCTHAKLAPLTPHPLAWDRHYGPALRQRGDALGQATFLPPFLLCYSSVWTVRLHSPFILGSIRISGLDGKLATGCLRIRPAWIVFCFRCWVADGKNGGHGEVRHWVLGSGGYALSPSCGALSERQKRPPGPILLHFSA